MKGRANLPALRDLFRPILSYLMLFEPFRQLFEHYPPLDFSEKIQERLKHLFRLFRIFRIFEITNSPTTLKRMSKPEEITMPSKEEQRIAMESYNALAATLENLHLENPEIEIEETKEKIRVPLRMLKLLAKILHVTSQGKPISVVPWATEVTTQAAADIIGCSRPYLVNLLEAGAIPFVKVGRHRRVMFEDVMAYKQKMKDEQRKRLIEMMRSDEESEIYDS